MPEYDYDLFTIGAGSGGVRAARVSAGLGARCGCAERAPDEVRIAKGSNVDGTASGEVNQGQAGN